MHCIKMVKRVLRAFFFTFMVKIIAE